MFNFYFIYCVAFVAIILQTVLATDSQPDTILSGPEISVAHPSVPIKEVEEHSTGTQRSLWPWYGGYIPYGRCWYGKGKWGGKGRGKWGGKGGSKWGGKGGGKWGGKGGNYGWGWSTNVDSSRRLADADANAEEEKEPSQSERELYIGGYGFNGYALGGKCPVRSVPPSAVYCALIH